MSEYFNDSLNETLRPVYNYNYNFTDVSQCDKIKEDFYILVVILFFAILANVPNVFSLLNKIIRVLRRTPNEPQNNNIQNNNV